MKHKLDRRYKEIDLMYAEDDYTNNNNYLVGYQFVLDGDSYEFNAFIGKNDILLDKLDILYKTCKECIDDFNNKDGYVI